jgi:hypothetical protein
MKCVVCMQWQFIGLSYGRTGTRINLWLIRPNLIYHVIYLFLSYGETLQIFKVSVKNICKNTLEFFIFNKTNYKNISQ